MKHDSSSSAKTSQIETAAPRTRVVLLGASNLSIAFPMVVETARAMFDGPLEFIVAKGFGRSYGQESKFFGKKFPGILQSELWDDIDRRAPLATVAVLADIGNDLAYGAPVETILAWVEMALDRLGARESRTVLNNLPLASLQSVGSARYLLFRELFFPNCRLSRSEMLSRADDLGAGLEKLAASRNTPIFSGEIDWYGRDPIHPRRRSAGAVWQRMLGALAAHDEPPALVRPSLRAAWRLRRLKASAWSDFGFQRRAAQPSGRLADGATIALY